LFHKILSLSRFSWPGAVRITGGFCVVLDSVVGREAGTPFKRRYYLSELTGRMIGPYSCTGVGDSHADLTLVRQQPFVT
jgi:hypothetical protein